MLVFLNGRLVPEKEAKVSVFDHGFMYGDGVYETLRTYNGKIWQLDEHLNRLKKSAKILDIPLKWSLKAIGQAIGKTVKVNGFKESRIRVTVTRGNNDYHFTGAKNPCLCIQVTKLIPEPAVVYEKGISAISLKMQRLLPEAKTISLLPLVLAKQQMERRKVYEAIYVDEKYFVREGSVTNVFMVKDGVLFTPKNGILLGTTRRAVIKVAKMMGLEVEEMDFTLSNLYLADECFITNAPRGIISLVKLDGKKIRNGKPGRLTGKIRKAFDQYVRYGKIA
jgi:branched-chain amino acid aminotransferase